MTREVLVSVRGTHAPDRADGEEIEVVSAGKYYFRDGCHYVFYEEKADDSGMIVKNRVTLKDGSLTVQRRGSLNAELVFEQGRKHIGRYGTPFGSMPAGVTVSEMTITEQERLLDIRVQYRLELNGEYVSDSRLRIRVTPENSGLSRLYCLQK